MSFGAKNPQSDDIAFPSPPSDGISSISVNGSLTSPTNMAIVGSWDNTVSCYELQYGANNRLSNVNPHAQIRHDAPVLCTDIASDGVTVFSAGCDNVLKMWNVTQGQTVQNVGQHNAPIRNLKFIPELNMVATSSWDRMVKLWDLRSPQPAAQVELSERVYAMDALHPSLVAATADQKMHVFDLTAGLSKKLVEYKSPLTYQSRCLSIFSDRTGYALGCIEGRIAIEYFANLGKSPSVKTTNFVFKCHRDKRENDSASDIYGVNGISFTPHNTFCSVGSDGVICIWDKDARHRLRMFERFKKQNTISTCAFTPQGNLLLYAVSYDWSMGQSNAKPGNDIYVHHVQPDEIAPKKK